VAGICEAEHCTNVDEDEIAVLADLRCSVDQTVHRRNAPTE
jgi:hypothetical protein